MSGWRNLVLTALIVPLSLAGLVTAAWAIDTHGDHDVRRGIEVGGTDVGGDDRVALTSAVKGLATKVSETPVMFNVG